MINSQDTNLVGSSAGSFPDITNPKIAAKNIPTTMPNVNSNRLWDEPPMVMAYIALRAIQNSKFKIQKQAMTRFQALLMS